MYIGTTVDRYYYANVFIVPLLLFISVFTNCALKSNVFLKQIR